MLSYSDRYQLVGNSGTLRAILTGAIVDAAVEVLNEDSTVPLHTSRLSWALRTLPNPDAMAVKMAFAVSGVDGIAEAVADHVKASKDLEVAVDAAVDAKVDVDQAQPVLDKRQAVDTVAQGADTGMLAAVRSLVNGFLNA